MMQDVFQFNLFSSFTFFSDSAPYYVTSLPNSSTSSPKRYLAYLAAFSRLATLRQVYDYLATKLRLRVEDMRLWYVREEVRKTVFHLHIIFVLGLMSERI